MNFPHPLELKARRRRLLFLAVIVLAAGGLAAWFLLPNEPTYHGRTLSAWLEDYSNPLMHVRSVREISPAFYTLKMEGARKAVLAIGTNAIPTLLKLTQATDSPQ